MFSGRLRQPPLLLLPLQWARARFFNRAPAWVRLIPDPGRSVRSSHEDV